MKALDREVEKGINEIVGALFDPIIVLVSRTRRRRAAMWALLGASPSIPIAISSVRIVLKPITGAAGCVWGH